MLKRILNTFFYFILSLPSLAFAECAQPIIPPLTYERANWSEIESLMVVAPVGPKVVKRQDVHADGHGHLNTDYFSITIDADGQSAAALLKEIRLDLKNTIFANTSYSDVDPLDEVNASLWASDDPTSSVIIFTLLGIPNVMPIKKAGVFVACFSPTSFVFSTIEEIDSGVHPVAGNRAFGVHDHGNGTLTVYVKATDRVVNSGIFAALPNVGREKVFKEGEKVWRGMLKNIAQKYAPRNPHGENIFSKRIPY